MSAKDARKKQLKTGRIAAPQLKVGLLSVNQGVSPLLLSPSDFPLLSLSLYTPCSFPIFCYPCVLSLSPLLTPFFFLAQLPGLPLTYHLPMLRHINIGPDFALFFRNMLVSIPKKGAVCFIQRRSYHLCLSLIPFFKIFLLFFSSHSCETNEETVKQQQTQAQQFKPERKGWAFA